VCEDTYSFHVVEGRSQQEPIKLRFSQRWEGKFLVQVIEYLLHKNVCSVELVMVIRVMHLYSQLCRIAKSGVDCKKMTCVLVLQVSLYQESLSGARSFLILTSLAEFCCLISYMLSFSTSKKNLG
jgi:hypothetical protein